jgi:hypothetical protein
MSMPKHRRRIFIMTTITETPGTPVPDTTPINPQTADAQEKIARLRAMADEFPEDAEVPPLTSAEIRLANSTSAHFLEKAALFAEAAPNVGGALSIQTTLLRDAVVSEFAYGGVIDEARTLIRRVERSIVRKKLNAVKTARGLYKVAKGYVAMDTGNPMTPHVLEMKRALRKPRRTKKAAIPPNPVPSAPQQPQ